MSYEISVIGRSHGRYLYQSLRENPKATNISYVKIKSVKLKLGSFQLDRILNEIQTEVKSQVCVLEFFGHLCYSSINSNNQKSCRNFHVLSLDYRYISRFFRKLNKLGKHNNKYFIINNLLPRYCFPCCYKHRIINHIQTEKFKYTHSLISSVYNNNKKELEHIRLISVEEIFNASVQKERFLSLFFPYFKTDQVHFKNEFYKKIASVVMSIVNSKFIKNSSH